MKVKIDKLDHFGRGISYINKKICFIKNALPGEIINIKITKEKKKYLEGEVINYLNLSSNRIKEYCPYANICGGCNLEHLSYEEENKYKKLKVQELIERFAKLNKDLVQDTTYNNEYYYRNKITLHQKNNELGYYKETSNDLISIKKCPLVNKKINEIISILNKLPNKETIKKVIIRTSNDEEKIMVKIIGTLENYNELLNKINVLIINNQIISKEDKIISKIGDKKYYVSIDSFFQVNQYLTEKLYDEVRFAITQYRPKKVLDLYCGTGTIGLYISDLVESVIGIDCSEEGIKNAKKNKKLNNTSNIKFICKKVEKAINSFKNDIDLIIVDPPRAGLDQNTITNIKRIAPKQIIYISCDPVTLSRDLSLLTNQYRIEYVKPYNMFPRTYHVENVSVLSRKEK